MILADKIIQNRKKNGWSQEELADKLDVSRQSISKWEGAQAVPDMKKILQLAEVFGVSTDYLLKDEIEDDFQIQSGTREISDEKAVKVSIEEANDFLTYNKQSALTVATGVMLCILSPIPVLILSGLAELKKINMSVETGENIGVVVLLLFIAAAVALFINVYMKGKRFEYLEKKNIDTLYGVTGFVRQKKNEYSDTHSRMIIIGVMLCIVSVIPVLLSETFNNANFESAGIFSTAIFLVLCAVGVWLIVRTCIIEGGFLKLLEERDYDRTNKHGNRYDGIYWGVATAVYFIWGFVYNGWQRSWIVWPVAGVLYALYREIIKNLINKNK